MSRPSRYQIVPLDEFLTESTVVVTKTTSLRRAIAGLAAVCVLTGVAVGLVATPPALAAAAGVRTVTDFWDSLPSKLPMDKVLPQQTILLDKDGHEFARLTSENRIDVGYADISPNFVHALVSAEDARFYHHHGYDITGIIRAAVKNTSSGSDTQGASTLTQQLVQNILISNATTKDEKAVAEGTSYQAKIREIKYAIGLEKTMTKNEILTAYANAVYFGNGAYGVEAAARTYFNTTAKTLTIEQAATLVAQLKSPTEFDPFTHPTDTKDRRDWIIGREVTERVPAGEDCDRREETTGRRPQGFHPHRLRRLRVPVLLLARPSGNPRQPGVRSNRQSPRGNPPPWRPHADDRARPSRRRRSPDCGNERAR